MAKRLFHIPILKCMTVITVFLLVVSGCSVSPEPLLGQWTDHSDYQTVSLNDKGEPLSSVPVGEWYFFRKDGRYVHIYRFVTFAVGGVSVEEGQFSVGQDTLDLKNRTLSFFPDEGSPQKASYREPIPQDLTIFYRLETKNKTDILYLRQEEEPEKAFYRLPDGLTK